MFELFVDMLPVLMLVAMGVSFWFGRKKGYSGIVLALVAFIFPIMAIVVFFLPDRNEMKRNAEAYRIREGQKSLDLRAEQELERMSILELRVIAMEHAGNGNEERALSFFEAAAKRGDMKAQHVCGIWYEEGRGCTIDYEKALYWYKQAAEQGFVKSQIYCAELYAEKLHDKENALYWYRKAAEQGDADAQKLLSNMQS